MSVLRLVSLVALSLFALFGSGAADVRVGLFEQQSDVGIGLLPGSAQFDAAQKEYRITGGGANMWGKQDAFHYLHNRVSGNLRLSCQLAFLGEGGDPHRKAGLMIRQSLEHDSPYVDIVIHGDGLASLQFREEKSGETNEIQAAAKRPLLLVLERQGDEYTAWVGDTEAELQEVSSIRISLGNAVYAGLAVCAHDASRLETAVFHDVTFESR
jgi:TolB protein